LRLLRWILTALALGGAYFATFAIAALLFTLVRFACPPELLISGACVAPWANQAEFVALIAATGAGAALFVGLPAAIAPSHKRVVAVSAYLLGLVIVGYVLWQLGASFIAPAVASASTGAMAAVLMWRRSNASSAAHDQLTPPRGAA
jgi:hypothetical protein